MQVVARNRVHVIMAALDDHPPLPGKSLPTEELSKSEALLELLRLALTDAKPPGSPGDEAASRAHRRASTQETVPTHQPPGTPGTPCCTPPFLHSPSYLQLCTGCTLDAPPWCSWPLRGTLLPHPPHHIHTFQTRWPLPPPVPSTPPPESSTSTTPPKSSTIFQDFPKR